MNGYGVGRRTVLVTLLFITVWKDRQYLHTPTLHAYMHACYTLFLCHVMSYYNCYIDMAVLSVSTLSSGGWLPLHVQSQIQNPEQQILLSCLVFGAVSVLVQ
jgi:hypothetical protein